MHDCPLHPHRSVVLTDVVQVWSTIEGPELGLGLGLGVGEWDQEPRCPVRSQARAGSHRHGAGTCNSLHRTGPTRCTCTRPASGTWSPPCPQTRSSPPEGSRRRGWGECPAAERQQLPDLRGDFFFYWLWNSCPWQDWTSPIPLISYLYFLAAKQVR